MTKEIIHSIILIIAIALTFLYPKTSLAQYDLQFCALLFIVLFLAKRFVPKKEASKLLESVIFTLIVLSIVNTTGSTASPFFFLVYFLLFSLALLLEPIISITASLTLIIFFLINLPEEQNLKNLLPIFSLAFLTPFALFLGQEFLQIQKLKSENQKLEEKTLLFLSLVLKNHLKTIKEAVENFMGDSQLEAIKKAVLKMEKLIDKFERKIS